MKRQTQKGKPMKDRVTFNEQIMKGVFQAYGLTWGLTPPNPVRHFLQTIATQSFVKNAPNTLTEIDRFAD